MTETSPGWVERPMPAHVAALTTQPAEPSRSRRERAVEQASGRFDGRVAGALAALVALAVLLVAQRRRR